MQIALTVQTWIKLTQIVSKEGLRHQGTVTSETTLSDYLLGFDIDALMQLTRQVLVVAESLWAHKVNNMT